MAFAFTFVQGDGFATVFFARYFKFAYIISGTFVLLILAALSTGSAQIVDAVATR